MELNQNNQNMDLQRLDYQFREMRRHGYKKQVISRKGKNDFFQLVAYFSGVPGFLVLMGFIDKLIEGTFEFFFLIIFISLLIPFGLACKRLIENNQIYYDHLEIKEHLKNREKPVPISYIERWFTPSSFCRNSYVDTIIRLDRLMDRGEIPEMYINYALGYLMPNTNLDTNELERIYLEDIHVKSYPCLNCGGVSHLIDEEDKICRYCNSFLPDYYGKDMEIERKKMLGMVSNTKSSLKRQLVFNIIGFLYFLLVSVVVAITVHRGFMQIIRTGVNDVGVYIVLSVLLPLITATVSFARATKKKSCVIRDYTYLENQLNQFNAPISIEKLAKEWDVPLMEAMRRVDQVLDHRMFPDMYLNESIKYLLFTDDIKNEKLRYEYLEKYNSIRYICKNCGGESILKRHQNKICNFCGNRLEDHVLSGSSYQVLQDEMGKSMPNHPNTDMQRSNQPYRQIGNHGYKKKPFLTDMEEGFFTLMFSINGFYGLFHLKKLFLDGEWEKESSLLRLIIAIIQIGIAIFANSVCQKNRKLVKDCKTIVDKLERRDIPVSLETVNKWFYHGKFCKNEYEDTMKRLERVLETGQIPEMYLDSQGNLMPYTNHLENEKEG